MLTPHLETLRPYAAAPPQSPPPEILPWPNDDPWNIDNAARTTLGYLLATDMADDTLFALADYLHAFIIPTYGSSSFRSEAFIDTLALNGAALALCGYLSAKVHPEAELWRVSGSARLASAAHLTKADLSRRLVADCVLTVCSIAEELQQPILADLITLQERMWGRLLDQERAERLHVTFDDYPKFLQEPIAADEVGRQMRRRSWQAHAAAPNYRQEKPDIAEAEAACNNLITLRAHMLVRHQFGSDIDWHLRLFDDKESTVSLNAQPFIRNLAAAYTETGDEKFARHAARLLWSFYKGAPIPNHFQPLGPWRTLETGNRQVNMWPGIIAELGQTEAFDEATHAMLARSRLEHMRYLLAFCGGPNNWFQVESSGLATAALFSPEVQQAEAILRIALRRLKWINSFAYYNDGFQFELTHLYHMFPTTSLLAVVQAARARQVDLPADFEALVARAHEMYLYAVQPNHILPMFNDCNPVPTDPAPVLLCAAELFDRNDLRWGGTHGLEGRPPDHASHAWPDCGYYLMRNNWRSDAHYLHFDGAPYGASHQHEDKLNFIVYAHGRPLLGDPNIYSYAWTEQTHYFKSSRAHNVVLIDGMGQARRFRPEARLTTQGQNEWVSRDWFDFVSSEYREGFAPDPYPDRASAAEVDERFSQRRAIFYVKNEYWILSDLILGPDDGAHTLSHLFHFAPLDTGDASEPLRAGEIDVSPQAVVTRDAGLGNLAILPADAANLQAEAVKGQNSPAAGWYGVLGEFAAWEVSLNQEASLPARFDAVLFPMPPGETALPRVEQLHRSDTVTAIRITGADFDDTFILCEDDSGPVSIGDITFQGRALLLRRQPQLQALTVDGQHVRVGGQDVALIT